MEGRNAKSLLAQISTFLLRFINIAIVAGAITTIVILFVIEHSPSMPTGWGLVCVGVVTILSGVLGCISSSGDGCCQRKAFIVLLSFLGLAAGFLLIYLKFHTVLHALINKLSYYDGRKLLRIEGAMYFVLCSLQIIVLVLPCLTQSCRFVDSYEDIEAADEDNIAPLRSLRFEV